MQAVADAAHGELRVVLGKLADAEARADMEAEGRAAAEAASATAVSRCAEAEARLAAAEAEARRQAAELAELKPKAGALEASEAERDDLAAQARVLQVRPMGRGSS